MTADEQARRIDDLEKRLAYLERKLAWAVTADDMTPVECQPAPFVIDFEDIPGDDDHARTS